MPLRIPHPSKPLHLYRHLLREASYLPPICRPWVTERIQTRFRDCRALETKDSRLCIEQAHHDLRYLRAANAGHLQRMMRICYMATGRLGKRRRELQKEYLIPEPAADSSALEDNAIKASAPRPERPPGGASKHVKAAGRGGKCRRETLGDRPFDWLDNWSRDKVLTLARSQVRNQTPAFPVQMRSITDPAKALPTENCWGEPFKPKVARHKLQRHFAKLFAQLMPPTPKGEWETLKSLALGEANDDMWAIPSRRKVAVSSISIPPGGKAKETWEWEKYLSAPVRTLQRSSSRKMRVLSGDIDDDPRGHGRPVGTRVYKSRLLRRSIYGALWESSPLMQKTQNGSWQVEWGRSQAKVSAPSASDLHFFKSIVRKEKTAKAGSQTIAG